MTPRCMGCGKTPEQIEEYVESAREDGNGETPSEFVTHEEGTYNPENGHFLCTACYINWGMPSSPVGWKCP